MQVLTEKNTQLSQELEERRAQLQAALAAAGSLKRPPLVIYPLSEKYHIKCGVYADLTVKLQMTLE